MAVRSEQALKCCAVRTELFEHRGCHFSVEVVLPDRDASRFAQLHPVAAFGEVQDVHFLHQARRLLCQRDGLVAFAFRQQRMATRRAVVHAATGPYKRRREPHQLLPVDRFSRREDLPYALDKSACRLHRVSLRQRLPVAASSGALLLVRCPSQRYSTRMSSLSEPTACPQGSSMMTGPTAE